MTTHCDRKKGSEQGFILLTSYLLIAVLEIFSIALFSRMQIYFQATERNQNKIVAFNMAEAGLDNTMVQLGSDSNYGGTAGTSVPLGNKGVYQITVCPPNCINLAPPAGPLVRFVQTAGSAPGTNPAAAAYEVRNIFAYLKLDSTPFERAAYAKDNLLLNGVPLVDSYNSANGPYGGLNIGAHGDIASDGTLSLIGNPVVNGQIQTNPGIDCKPATTTIPSSGALIINGNADYQLAAGTYHFDSISVTGNGKITALGPVTIYVDGSVSFGGNGVATFNDSPSNFLVLATGDGTVSVAGGSNFYAGIYAPHSSVNNGGNSTLYGSVISKNYQQNGTADLHFDEAMKNVTAPCNQVDLLSWRETNTAAG